MPALLGQKTMQNPPLQILVFATTHLGCGGHIDFSRILLSIVSLPIFQSLDGSDQTAQLIDFRFADYVDVTQI
jgi:hypothetical protein